jgi:hypothetical protein
MIFDYECPKHHFRYISMPRGLEGMGTEESTDPFYVAKCPLKRCGHGIPTPRVIDTRVSLALDMEDLRNGQE